MIEFIKYLHDKHFDDIPVFEEAYTEFKEGKTFQHSSGIEDGLYLYLLVKEFKPKIIVEIGTHLGPSTFSLAFGLEHNDIKGSKVYTIDNGDKCLIDKDRFSNIVYLKNMHSNVALKLLEKENVEIDMVFCDANITLENVESFNKLCTKNAVLTTHDFVPPMDKGREFLALIR